MAKILKWSSFVTLTSLPMIAFSSCSSTNNTNIEVETFLDSLTDSFALDTFSSKVVAEDTARQYSLSIRYGEEYIPNNNANASIFTTYPFSQQISDDLVMQLQALSAKQNDTTIILTVRVEYAFNDSHTIKHYSEEKDLIIEFYKAI
ncbi:MAG: hypothetical protein ACRCXE_01365 [Metamycoplasmataceae bacterium]